MRWSVNIIVLFSIFLYTCSLSQFVLTGKQYPPLPESSEVKVVAWGDQGRYEIIGIVDIGETSLDKRIEEAKRVARNNGADIIMPKVARNGEELSSSNSGFLLQSFLVMRTKEEVSNEIGDEIKEEERQVDILKSSSEEMDEGKESYLTDIDTVKDTDTDADRMQLNYRDLPRATFKLLVEEYETLKGERFRGSLFATKLSKIPAELSLESGDYKGFLETTTKTGKYKLYLLIPKDDTLDFTKMIKSKERLNFVYTPVTVYRSKYPVLEFLDLIKE